MRISLAAAAGILLIGCSGNEQVAADTSVANSTGGIVQQQATVALGLTVDQLEDAEILDANGREIADVERVVRDTSGAITGLLVEVEDSDPDRYVTIPLMGLTLVQNGDDRDLRSTYTRDALMAMPEVRR